MRIKKFRAETLPEAVSMMKAEFGDDAIILHTNIVKTSRFFGLFGKKQYEVLGAVDPNQENNKKPHHVTAGQQEPQPAANQGLDWGTEDGSSAIQFLYQLLARQELSQTLAVDIVKSILRQVPKQEWNETPLLKRMLRAEISSLIRVDKPWEFDDGQKVVALVGPTGVGKTTTIAKLAANYHLIARKKVGLITLDTYRIAAVEQLKKYADIMNVPLTVVYSTNGLSSALASYTDMDLVLIDTFGCSHHNQERMSALKSAFESLDIEKYLVVSATTKSNDLMAIIDAFKELGIDNLIVTKLDETRTYGILVEAPSYAQVPIAFITNGQSVPDDIEIAENEQLTSMVLEG